MANSESDLSAGNPPVPQNDYIRIVRLCDRLQHYRDATRSWGDARAEKRDAIRADRNGQVSGDELRRAVAMFDVEDRSIHGEVDSLNDLIHLLVKHRHVDLLPSMAGCRVSREPPHEVESFDWQAFSRELLAARDEATRCADEKTADAKPAAASTAPPAKAKRVRKQNRRPGNGSPTPLTDRQSEALRLFGELNGNMSQVARRMGVTAPTAKQHYDVANEKLGTTLSARAKRTRLAADDLGQGVEGLPARRRGKELKVDD